MEIESSGVHAVSQPRRWWAVFKDVPQVSATATAQHFRAWKKQFVIGFLGNVILLDRLVETWPTGARFVFGFTRIQRQVAAGTVIHAATVFVPVRIAEGGFGTGFSQYIELFGRQFGSPVRFRFIEHVEFKFRDRRDLRFVSR